MGVQPPAVRVYSSSGQGVQFQPAYSRKPGGDAERPSDHHKRPHLTRYLKEHQDEQKKTQSKPSKSEPTDAVPKKPKTPSVPKKPPADSAPADEAPTAATHQDDNEVVSRSPQRVEDQDSIIN